MSTAYNAQNLSANRYWVYPPHHNPAGGHSGSTEDSSSFEILYSCPKCLEMVPESMLRDHISLEMGYTPIRCGICRTRFTSFQQHSMHAAGCASSQPIEQRNPSKEEELDFYCSRIRRAYDATKRQLTLSSVNHQQMQQSNNPHYHWDCSVYQQQPLSIAQMTTFPQWSSNPGPSSSPAVQSTSTIQITEIKEDPSLSANHGTGRTEQDTGQTVEVVSASSDSPTSNTPLDRWDNAATEALQNPAISTAQNPEFAKSCPELGSQSLDRVSEILLDIMNDKDFAVGDPDGVSLEHDDQLLLRHALTRDTNQMGSVETTLRHSSSKSQMSRTWYPPMAIQPMTDFPSCLFEPQPVHTASSSLTKMFPVKEILNREMPKFLLEGAFEVERFITSLDHANWQCISGNQVRCMMAVLAGHVIKGYLSGKHSSLSNDVYAMYQSIHTTFPLLCHPTVGKWNKTILCDAFNSMVASLLKKYSEPQRNNKKQNISLIPLERVQAKNEERKNKELINSKLTVEVGPLASSNYRPNPAQPSLLSDPIAKKRQSRNPALNHSQRHSARHFFSEQSLERTPPEHPVEPYYKMFIETVWCKVEQSLKLSPEYYQKGAGPKIIAAEVDRLWKNLPENMKQDYYKMYNERLQAYENKLKMENSVAQTPQLHVPSKNPFSNPASLPRITVADLSTKSGRSDSAPLTETQRNVVVKSPISESGSLTGNVARTIETKQARLDRTVQSLLAKKQDVAGSDSSNETPTLELELPEDFQKLIAAYEQDESLCGNEAECCSAADPKRELTDLWNELESDNFRCKIGNCRMMKKKHFRRHMIKKHCSIWTVLKGSSRHSRDCSICMRDIPDLMDRLDHVCYHLQESKGPNALKFAYLVIETYMTCFANLEKPAESKMQVDRTNQNESQTAQENKETQREDGPFLESTGNNVQRPASRTDQTPSIAQTGLNDGESQPTETELQHEEGHDMDSNKKQSESMLSSPLEDEPAGTECKEDALNLVCSQTQSETFFSLMDISDPETTVETLDLKVAQLADNPRRNLKRWFSVPERVSNYKRIRLEAQGTRLEFHLAMVSQYTPSASSLANEEGSSDFSLPFELPTPTRLFIVARLLLHEQTASAVLTEDGLEIAASKKTYNIRYSGMNFIRVYFSPEYSCFIVKLNAEGLRTAKLCVDNGEIPNTAFVIFEYFEAPCMRRVPSFMKLLKARVVIRHFFDDNSAKLYVNSIINRNKSSL